MPSTPVPAVLAIDAQSHAALVSAVRGALNDANVVIADDALTTSSELMLEFARPREASGRLMQGRETRLPEVFRLYKQAEECVLVHERTRREFVLAGAKCVLFSTLKSPSTSLRANGKGRRTFAMSVQGVWLNGEDRSV